MSWLRKSVILFLRKNPSCNLCVSEGEDPLRIDNSHNKNQNVTVWTKLAMYFRRGEVFKYKE